MTTGKEAKREVEETTGNRRTRRTTLTRKSRREIRTRRRHLPRKEKLTRKRPRDVPGVWCKHHMARGNHKKELCQHGSECTNQQINGLNQVAAQAALATILSPKWQALIANMARNMANN
jgi:hypothetical protein